MEKKEESFPNEELERKNEKIMAESDKFVKAFLAEHFPEIELTDEEVTMELGEVGSFLHSAFRAGASL